MFVCLDNADPGISFTWAHFKLNWTKFETPGHFEFTNSVNEMIKGFCWSWVYRLDWADLLYDVFI